MMKRIPYCSNLAAFLAAIAITVIGTWSAEAADTQLRPAANTGISENWCKLMGGETSPAPGPHPDTFECCFDDGQCEICSPKGCDPVDWGDVSSVDRPTKHVSKRQARRDRKLQAQRDRKLQAQRDRRRQARRDRKLQAKRDRKLQARVPGNSFRDGQSCKVVSGPNRGESGTFDEGYCCDEKDWGCTQCTNGSASNGKCEAQSIRRPFHTVGDRPTNPALAR